MLRFYVKWKVHDNSFNSWIDKKKIYYKYISRKISQYNPKSYERFIGNVKVELYLSNYSKKARLKGATGFDASSLATKSSLASLKADVDKIDI